MEMKCLTKKKTNEEFIEQVYDLVKDEYSVISEYSGSKNKINIIHNICEHRYWAVPSDFISKGSRCPKCALIKQGNKRRKTDEEFTQEVYNLVGEDYKFLENYKKSSERLKIRHSCGREYKVSPSHFLSGSRCSKCSFKGRKTNEDFLKEVNDLEGDNYLFLEEYVNSVTKLSVKHNKCGSVYKIKPSEFTSGSRCYACSKIEVAKLKTKTTEFFSAEVTQLVGDEYSVIGNYKKSSTKVDFIHIKCGKTFKMTPSNFLGGARCPICRGISNTPQLVSKVKEILGEEYSVIGDYVSSRAKIKFKHNECNKTFNMSTNSFISGGNRCPNCRFSKGEKIIDNFLRRKNHEYIPQYRIKECKYKKPLPFDFAVFKRDEIYLLIEYDGRQHFEPVTHFGGEETFKQQQINDDIKNTYCKENNIPLLRIPYWDYDNIESILEKELIII